jgi:hypothetical protein
MRQLPSSRHPHVFKQAAFAAVYQVARLCGHWNYRKGLRAG